MSEQDQQCPRCDGTQRVSGVRFVTRGEAGCTAEDFNEPCEMCGGAGRIGHDQAERYRIGRYFHEARMDAALSLKRCADAWGGSPAAWSMAERLGIGPAWMFGRMDAYLEYDGVPPDHAVEAATRKYDQPAAEPAREGQ